ncbi:MAG: CusA/CzcA family heavy metal efflux RND transporter [Bacteroidetes bacterium]|nr:CusA/CzcA family heavy metal efflux RND transporter [Bacteroidota bacterium]
MLNSIITFSIRNKLIVALGILGLIGYGIINLTRLPIDAVPDITNNQVLVITSSPALGAGDIERLITFPIEQATRNIPGIIEQRSFSRFGLSLVTIVFNDETDVYWARQQVSEKLSQVQISPTLGVPQLGPVTTGLGEIFQYVVKPLPGYENKYSAMELRTIQDWVVRRQLLGTEGVADVSSFGGKLKQYEIAVSPDKLKASGTTIPDLMRALEKNNQNTGGAYIENGPAVLFIRSEGLVKSEDEIGSIMIKTLANGTPLLIRDVAKVQLGMATRYGAMTYNDMGEVAGAVVMMLKGENSSKVIKNVKKKIEEIQKTLPEGVAIEAFLDRTKMVDNAIGTVEKNLMEGALIVILVLVLFLGNIRAGFVVASVIPLSMLFAIIMMNLFGVSGNLMSLGALDFGLIVDGAVIIVEAVMHRLHDRSYFNAEGLISRHDMDERVGKAAGKMMNAAVFGQIIILIVYLPILSLQGIEGKMFRPMAQTVAFAIMGAFLLSLTYVPMMSSWVLSRRYSGKQSISDRMMARVERFYIKALEGAMRFKKTILLSAVSLFIVALIIIMNMGGEFIPKLEEGDFAVDTRVLTGSSLSTTIKVTQQAAHVLKSRFPEIEKVVTKIGSGEIPTDPMPVEASDMMVILKPKSEWTSARSFDELAEKMSEALSDIPGITPGFQFPVQMRFNELMTGGRQDVVCKIFGENLDTLSKYAAKLGGIVKSVEGATDLYVETATGLPQIVVDYKRPVLAQYGLSVEDVNAVLQAAFAGAVCGQVFENERRFDLVIRLDQDLRQNVSDIRNVLIATPSGQQIPLSQVADVDIKTGPNQIQREDAQRRITVGFNVRGKDVQTVVKELQAKVNGGLGLPRGNYITYGGAFENLQEATKRLAIAVPVALLLILVLLYFAFRSLQQGLLIYSAIPLSAIGGVLALWICRMPFSISAGVGFIALFGVAVLNGIVLISEFNQLKAGGMEHVRERILTGTKNRLRPVLMTACVASLGFFPMALSHGAGAEVQRPLATVVIGGLVTATLLTLLVLPLLYEWLELRHQRKNKVAPSALSVLVLVLAIGAAQRGRAQSAISLQAATDTAMKQNLSVQAAALQTRSYKAMEGSAWDLPATSLNGDYGQFNSAFHDSRLGVSQSFSLPAVYNQQKQLLKAETHASELNEQLMKLEVQKQVTWLYYQMLIYRQKQVMLKRADSLYQAFSARQEERYKKGDANSLELASARLQQLQVSNQLRQVESDIRLMQVQFNRFLNAGKVYSPADGEAKIQLLSVPDSSKAIHTAYMSWKQQQSLISKQQWQVEKAKLWPAFTVGYNNQSLTGYQNVYGTDTYYGPSKRFSYMSFGMSAPLFFKAARSRIKASKLNYEFMQKELADVTNLYQVNFMQWILRFEKSRQNLLYFEEKALPQSDIISNSANQQLQSGSIGFMDWVVLMSQSMNVRMEYYQALSDYNQAVIELNYLSAGTTK